MRISDWSSDVCSSDLLEGGGGRRRALPSSSRSQVGRFVERAFLRRQGGKARCDGRRACRCMIVHPRRQRWPVGSRRMERSRAAITGTRSEEHTSELQSLMRISYAVFCLKKKTEKMK